MTILALNECMQRAVNKALLSITDIEQFRSEMSHSLQNLSPQMAAFYLGCQAATPGMAFLSGYQAALRCLDPACTSTDFAAFCVSEKGIKKPWDMETRLTKFENTWALNGQKGFVMLLPDLIDSLYVLAKEDDGSLTCVQVKASSNGILASDPLNAPFVQDIPHAGIIFENVELSVEQILIKNGHEEANKPFRYWEDIHVAIAMLGWMLRQMKDRDDFELRKQIILEKLCQLIEKFTEQSKYYSKETLNLLNSCHELLESQSGYLPELALSQWKVDRLLLQMGYKIRSQISKKLA